ncbi:glycerophosphodiester phosphodiesterase [Streptacidiphilus anmyonensis]|uniref:glycerophosphodiester phosphodiesterase n=1 Tax=Streptacidiphilus anmyonensis TaxID=405782 RepID=UPI001F30BE59|nr:glycerophosphodiester phosphodiesterase [Streptacidiphilus anmyonensis]
MTSDSALRPGRPAARHPYLDHPGPLAFAHRGGTLGGPENSMAAFERAVRLGYRYLETDVHTTADGVLVAFHDDRLDRVTDGTGAVAQLPWRIVSAARIGGREAIPTLEELLDAFPETRFNIDVKAAAAVRPLVDAVRRTNAWDRVCVGSFSETRLAAVRAAAGPRLATSAGPRDVAALKVRSLARGGLPLGRGARRRAVCLQVPERVAGGGDTGPRLVDRAFVETAHALGLQVHVWTVNEADRMRSLLDLGVDGIMTDHIDVLRDVLIERGAWI